MSELLKKLTTDELIKLEWKDLEPHYTALADAKISSESIEKWMRQWTLVSDVQDELFNRVYVVTSVNTADKEAQARFDKYMEEIYPKAMAAEQKLKEKLLSSGLMIEGFEVPMRNMREEFALFREENLPLLVKEEKLINSHDKIMGAQTVQWQGEEKTVRQMEVTLREKDRNVRKTGWETMAERQLADRETINTLWKKFMSLRADIAENADMPSFREYRWKKLLRFDYTPEDCKSFHNAIEEAVVPVVKRLAERRKKTLGLDSLRYYDLFVDLTDKPPLKPFSNVRELKDKAASIFDQVLPQFGIYFRQMDTEGFLDLENRKNKANGGYCTDFAHVKRPFIFANAVGIHDDVQTLLHEGGHAFHAFESFKLPYFQQRTEAAIAMEFAEVASMTMELMSLRYIGSDTGGFYSEAEAARAKVDHLEQSLMFWPYMAIVDAFQHWVYENPKAGSDPDQCDSMWAELEKRFRPHIDWNGYEDVMMTGWHRKDHIHQIPFYYVEYGLAQLGAVQIWKNSLEDEKKAVASYRKALTLGGTATLPDLFETAGAKFAFDAETLKQAADLMEKTIISLEEMY